VSDANEAPAVGPGDDAALPAPRDPAESVRRLVSLFDLERLDRDLFRASGRGPWGMQRLFGGQVAAQALRAAANTVDVDHRPHSFHGYFLRPGIPKTPVIMQVDRIRDGRSFTTRRVNAIQEGEAIFSLIASFHRDEPDREYQSPPPAGVPDPDADVEWFRSPMARFDTWSPFEVRELAPTPADERGRIASTRRVWMRTRAPVDGDQLLHDCLLTFLSDMGAMYAAILPVAAGRGTEVMGASLDHAVWFHRPVRLDEWVLFDLSPVSNAGSRGLVHGTFHTREGVHAASMSQEALLRFVGRRG
jgi:acyl-CoA thioesterase-2